MLWQGRCISCPTLPNFRSRPQSTCLRTKSQMLGSMNNVRQRIHELDGVRAIAILLVIGCHYEWFSTNLGGLPKLGWIGVDLFFVLSGFLITSVLLQLKDTPHPLVHFYQR